MPVPTLIIHIGTAKTGSTAIQTALHRHRDELRNHGIAYLPGDGFVNNRDLAAACVGVDGDDDLLDRLGIAGPEAATAYRERVVGRLHAEAATLSDDVHTVVLSSEHFHSRLVAPPMVRRLSSAVAPLADRVRIVCYLRPQVDLIASFYSTYLRNGGTETLDEVGDRLLRLGHPYADYDHLLTMWAGAFGESVIEPRVFGEFDGGTVLTDIASTIGAPSGVLAEQAPENTSISRFGQALLLAVNRAISAGASADRLEAVRSSLAAAFGGPGDRWMPEEAGRRQATFDAGNEAVRRRWLPERDRLFPGRFGDVPTMELTDAQRDVLAEVFAGLASAATTGPDVAVQRPRRLFGRR